MSFLLILIVFEKLNAMSLFIFAYSDWKVFIFHFKKCNFRQKGFRDRARPVTSLVRVSFDKDGIECSVSKSLKTKNSAQKMMKVNLKVRALMGCLYQLYKFTLHVKWKVGWPSYGIYLSCVYCKFPGNGQ